MESLSTLSFVHATNAKNSTAFRHGLLAGAIFSVRAYGMHVMFLPTEATNMRVLGCGDRTLGCKFLKIEMLDKLSSNSTADICRSTQDDQENDQDLEWVIQANEAKPALRA